MTRDRPALAALAGEDLFRSLIESAPDAMVIVDSYARIALVNAQTERLFGYDREELLGRDIELLLPKRFHDAHRGHRDGFLAAPSTRPMGAGLELFARRKDGTEFPVDISLSPLRTETGVLVASAIRDVSERKRVEREIRRLADEAERANAAKSEFLSRMSHELRTPLNGIIGFAQLLELEEPEGERRESVEQILKASRHLLSLINEVLDISQVESGRLSLSLEPVDVAHVVAEAATILSPQAAEHGVSMDVGGGEDVVVLADRQRLLQVLLNLVGNAVKYNRPGGRVEISWRRSGAGRAAIVVADDGPGIDAEHIAQIFAPFERSAAAPAIEGSGLGLAVAQALALAMDGRLDVKSELGTGSTFVLDLAEAAPAPEALAGHAAPPELDGRRRLLHIDDNPTSRRLVERIAERVPSLAVTTASRGAAGIALAAAEPPDLILLDLHLPDLPGQEVLRRLRALPATARTPIVVLSADSTRKAHDEALAAGATTFLTKPVDADRLLAIVAEL